MCEPATITAIGVAVSSAASAAATAAAAAGTFVAANAAGLSLATSVAATAASAYGMHQTAKATDKSSRDEADIANAGLEANQRQVNAQATDQMAERSKQALREAGTINAIFADSGLSGSSQDRLLMESAGAASADLTTIERNRINGENQNANEAAAITARAQSQMNSAKRPSLIGTGLQIAKAGTRKST